LSVHGEETGFAPPGQVTTREDRHLPTWARFNISVTGINWKGHRITEQNHLGLQVWPNGNQQRVLTHWEGFNPGNHCERDRCPGACSSAAC
jgi:hypothetical protein